MLKPKQEKCIELMVGGRYTQKEIAEKLKVAEATICNWKKTDEFMAEYNSTLKSSIKDAAAKAFKTEVALLDAKTETVRLAAAKDILDRSGFKPDDSVNVNIEPVVIVNDLEE